MCGAAKVDTEYFRRGDGKGLRSECKSCGGAANHKWRRENPEGDKLYGTTYQKEHKPRLTNKRHKNRLKTYGITVLEYECLEIGQGRRCGICSEAFTKTPAVDHDHKTGKVRGLLCRPCNSAIGFLKDNPQHALSAARYLEKHHAL